MSKNGFKVMDSDMHVMEPIDLWDRYMKPKFRDRAPRPTYSYFLDQRMEHEGKVISRSQVSFDNYSVLPTEMMTDRYGNLDQLKKHQERGWGPDVQLEAMDAEGVDVAILFPGLALSALGKEYDDDDLAADVARAYNDWMADFCREDNTRLYGVGMISVQNVEAAVQEVIRIKQELEFRAVYLRPNPIRGRNWHHSAYDPIWAECEKQGLALGFHEGIPHELPVVMGDRFQAPQDDLWLTEHVAAHPLEQMYACLSFIMGGVLERFPTLQVGFLEGNCSWAPFWLWRMDEHWEHRERYVKSQLPLRPSEYFKRQCYISVEADETPGTFALEWLGDENIVFSTDYPHTDTRYPHALDTFLEMPFSKENFKRILWDNCTRLYGFT